LASDCLTLTGISFLTSKRGVIIYLARLFATLRNDFSRGYSRRSGYPHPHDREDSICPLFWQHFPSPSLLPDRLSM
jgi:hypothetical protein